jgi:pimeloyl-ACP methyl ester carboxylesterase
MEAACAALPIETVELSPDRRVALHRRPAAAGADNIVFVHGSMASMLQWQAQIEHFAAAGFGVAAYDFLGCGRSEAPADWYAYSTPALYADVKAVIALCAAGQTGRLILVGHSAGCALVVRYAAEVAAAPHAGVQPLAGMVLCAPLYSVPRSVGLFRLPLFLLEALRPMLSSGFAERALHEITRRGETEAHRQLLALSAEASGGNAMHVCKAYYRQWELPTDEVISAAKQPALLLCGPADLLAPADAHAMALRPLLDGARDVVLVPDAAHQLMQEQPDECNAQVRAFVASLGR